MDIFNWGIIGPGKIAHDFARDLSLIQSPQKIIAVLSDKADSAQLFATEYQVKNVHTDLASFAENQNMHAVYIASPHPQHFKQAMACLEKKIPVLCEKPMTINAEQASALVANSQKQQCFLMEGMWLRFLPMIEKMLSLVQEGVIGKVLSIKASMGYKAPKEPGSRYFEPSLGGGSLLDLGIYPVFLAHLLLGKPMEIKAIATLTEKGVDESFSILFKYETGAHAVLDSSLVTQSDRPAEIAGERGILRILNPWFGKVTRPGIGIVRTGKNSLSHSMGGTWITV